MKKPIVIDNWQKGISDSPFTGLADLRNIDVNSVPGLALINFLASKYSGTTVTGLIKWAVRDTDANSTVYVVDTDHKVYKADITSTWQTWSLVTHGSASTGHGNGLGIFKNFLILPGDSALDVMNLTTGTWTNGFKSFLSTAANSTTDTFSNPVLVGQDDVCYGGHGPDDTGRLGAAVWSLAQVTGKVFDPTDGTTFTWNANAQQFPYPCRISCLEELGINLMVGTWQGKTTSGSNTYKKWAKIYPWDRANNYSLPIDLQQAGVNAMKNINNVLYIQAGQLGSFYISTGSSNTRFLFRLPRDTDLSPTGATADTYFRITTMYPGAIGYHKNKLFFGMTKGPASGVGQSGVYSVNLDGTGLVMENTVSGATTDGLTLIGAILPLQDFNFDYLIGWQNASAQGVDVVGESNYNSSYSAYIDSQVYQISTDFENDGVKSIDIYLDRPLASGQGVKLSFRSDMSQTPTQIKDKAGNFVFDYATFGAKSKISFNPANIPLTENLQIRTTLTGGSTTPRLKRVILH